MTRLRLVCFTVALDFVVLAFLYLVVWDLFVLVFQISEVATPNLAALASLTRRILAALYLAFARFWRNSEFVSPVLRCSCECVSLVVSVYSVRVSVVFDVIASVPRCSLAS